jgi:NTP pyrophosphatase (non-canonical NTP hydrolase)
MDDLREIAAQVHRDSAFWFGEELTLNAPYMCLALCGEVGEVANIIKKLQRGSLVQTEEVRNDIAEEITDSFIYVIALAHACGVDLGKAYDAKRAINIGRWGDPDARPTQ